MSFPINKLPTCINIGRIGENKFRSIEFDLTEWFENHPSGTVSLIFIRPDGNIYPVTVNVKENICTWQPTSTDLAVAGNGSLEIRITSNDSIGKSAVIKTITNTSLGAPDVAPSAPVPDWVQTVAENASKSLTYSQEVGTYKDTYLTKAQECVTNATNAANSASNAATSATNAASSASSAATSATNANSAKTAAESAKTTAVDAKTAAETAQGIAETAANTATQKALEASNSATNLATAVTNASSSATAAKSSEDNAKSSETKSKTSETNAKTSETNAKTSEINSAQAYADFSNALGSTVATLSGGKVPLAQIPATATQEIYRVASASELTGLVAQKGDIAELIESVNGEFTITKVWQLLENNPTVLSNWVVWGTSYAVLAGNATLAVNAQNASMINGMSVVYYDSQAAFNAATKTDSVYYFVKGV